MLFVGHVVLFVHIIPEHNYFIKRVILAIHQIMLRNYSYRALAFFCIEVVINGMRLQLQLCLVFLLYRSGYYKFG